MKKLFLLIAFMAFALLGFGQYTITNEGNNIKVASTTESISFSKEGLIFQYISPRLYFISNDKLYPFLWTEIDSPSYSTIDSLYNAVASWLPSMTYTSMTADTITDGVATLTGGNWTGINLMAVDTMKLNNWLMTDYITDGSKVDDEDGFPLSIGNTILGYNAFANTGRAGDSAALSTFIGYGAGYNADTIYKSFFGCYRAGLDDKI